MTVAALDPRGVSDALSVEVRAMLADRGWTFREAAEAFGLPLSRMGNLLCRQTQWTVADLLAVARVTGNDEDEETERLITVSKRGAFRIDDSAESRRRLDGPFSWDHEDGRDGSFR